MCFHPWSDVTLPLMSIGEILEVIREWIRQYQDMSKTYRWVQVIIIVKSLIGSLSSVQSLSVFNLEKLTWL